MSGLEPVEPIYDEDGDIIWNIPAGLSNEGEIWAKIVMIHNSAKAVILEAEQADEDQDCFIQPMNEQRNAWEHVVRAKGHELGLTRMDSEDYVIENLKKTLAHEYRAFFDAADIYSNELQTQIADTLETYTRAQIKSVIEDYYPVVQPKWRRLRLNIAHIREQKDIAKGKEFHQIDEYLDILREMKWFWVEIGGYVDDLETAKATDDRERALELRKIEISERRLRIAIVAIFVTILLAILSHIVPNQTQESVVDSLPVNNVEDRSLSVPDESASDSEN